MDLDSQQGTVINVFSFFFFYSYGNVHEDYEEKGMNNINQFKTNIYVFMPTFFTIFDERTPISMWNRVFFVFNNILFLQIVIKTGRFLVLKLRFTDISGYHKLFFYTNIQFE